MTTVNDYLRSVYGTKVYKLALNGGFTCPNRDGTKGSRGCIFCSAGGSGDFAESPQLPVSEQLALSKQRVAAKIKNGRYIAYFQAYTGTYAPASRLRKLYYEAASDPDVVIISIATRPDCLGPDVLELLAELNTLKPVWVELGLQTIHEKTAEYIRRAYPLSVYDKAVNALTERGIKVITHVILGLPGEDLQMMKDTVSYVCARTWGIKLQLLHILKGTDLADEYAAGRVRALTEDEYMDILAECIQLIPDDVVVHRLTGDGPKKLLIAPMWSADKKNVINRVRKVVSGLQP